MGTTEDEMVEWYHPLDGHELEQAPGVGDAQGSLVCCGPWGHKDSYMTTGKTIALTRWTFVDKVMSLLFNTLPRFIIA